MIRCEGNCSTKPLYTSKHNFNARRQERRGTRASARHEEMMAKNKEEEEEEAVRAKA
jgi:hypothetical protein